MQKNEVSWGERAITVCVDSYADGVLEGRLYHAKCETGMAFRSMSRFLTEMDRALDAMAFPQSFNAVRTFGEKALPPVLPLSAAESRKGVEATFSVRVLFRQNASWQGSIRWIEGNREEGFRSALELIFLMDSVLDQDDDEIRVG